MTISSYFFRRKKRLMRLLSLMIVATVIFAGYLYGIIEIDSQKVVFKIVPSSFHSHNSNNLNRNYFHLNNLNKESSNKQSSTNEDYSNLNVHNDFINNNRAADSDSNKYQLANKQKLEIEKNITKLFHTIERYSIQIKALLRPYEASNIADLKDKYEKLAKERKLRLKEEFEKLKLKETNKNDVKAAEENKTPPAAANETAAGSDASYGDLSLIADLASHEMISRDLMVRFLRYENFRLKKKPSKEIRTIKTLLNQYDLNKELDIRLVENRMRFLIKPIFNFF